MKDNKSQELMNKLQKVFDLLSESVDKFSAFKILFILFFYKHSNDTTIPMPDMMKRFGENIIKVPDNCKWNHLINSPIEHLFTQIDTNFPQLDTDNNVLQDISKEINISMSILN